MIIRFKLKRIKKVSIQIFLLFILILQIQSVYAWDNCPFGEVNESFPGTCGRYTDTDNDNICDLSQLPPELRVESQENNSKNLSNDLGKNSNSKSSIKYYFVPITITLFSIYLITLYLSRIKKIKISQHRKFWNFILLLTFLTSGIFGILLTIIISYGIKLTFYSDLLFWHVEFGIAMAIISIFHILCHIKYFKKMFQLNK